MKFSASTLGIGMGAGLVEAIFCVTAEMRRGGPIAWFVLGACLIGGIGCALTWSSGIQSRCDRYQEALRKHGIDPSTA